MHPPGQLLFRQDMVTRQMYESNWSYLSKRRFAAILNDNDRENAQRLGGGHHVMLRVPHQFRVKTKAVSGPFPIQVHTNGTNTIEKGAGPPNKSVFSAFFRANPVSSWGSITRLLA